jgi:hypothetical protein
MICFLNPPILMERGPSNPAMIVPARDRTRELPTASTLTGVH